MVVSKQMKRTLMAKAHHLKPVVMVGQKGVTESVIAEVDRALFDHELIKVKLNGEDKAERKEMMQEICDNLSAEAINLIGSVGIIYRESEK